VGIQITLTDADATRYLKWAANIRQPREASNGGQQQEQATTRDDLASRRSELAEIRKWAGKHGFKIAAKGRIPAPVMEAYERAH